MCIKKMAQLLGFIFKLGEPAVVPNYFDLDIYQWMPDAHIPVMRHPTRPGKWRSVWSGGNYYLLGDTPYPEDHKELENKEKILDSKCDDPACWHNGGAEWRSATVPMM